VIAFLAFFPRPKPLLIAKVLWSSERSDMVESAKEEAYWRERHAKQPYAKREYSYDDYAAAYRTGYEGFHKYLGKPYDEIEDELALDYERNKAGAALPWDHARHAVHAAWAKVSQDIGPRDADRGIRGAI